jgi:hypothetical protein
MEAVCGEDIQEKRDDLKPEDIGEEGGDQVGLSLQDQLELASAADIPPAQNLDSVVGRIDHHETDEKGGHIEADNLRMEDHQAWASILAPGK